VAVAYVSAAPAEEGIISDVIESVHPAADQGIISKKTLIKGIIILKVKKAKKLLKKKLG
jgi:hypothetical protein